MVKFDSSINRLLPIGFLLLQLVNTSIAFGGFDLRCNEIRSTGHSFDVYKKKLVMDKIVKKKGTILKFQTNKKQFVASIHDGTMARYGSLVQVNHKTVYQYVDYNNFGEIGLWRYYPEKKFKDGTSLLYHYQPSGHLTIARMTIQIFSCQDMSPKINQ